MRNYMLLFHESRHMFRDLSPSEFQAIIAKYTAWRRRLEAEGRSSISLPEYSKSLTVWARQPDGSWKWLLDAGNDRPAPATP